MKKVSKFLVPLMLFLLIIASIVWYLFIYDRAFTRDALLGQARFHDLHGNSKLSSLFYDAAYNFSGHDDNVAIELANQYKGDGNYTKAEFTLTHAISSNPTLEGYSALCATYAEQDKLMDAVALMQNIQHPEIQEALQAMRPKAPVSDFASGYYSQYADIHLSSSCETIYYTTDGSFPSINGSRFEDKITLPSGETTIKAIAVDENGLVSPVTVLEFTVTGVIEEVIFTDPVMESAIRAAIGASDDQLILTNSLWDITEFTIPEGAALYDDVSLLPNLEKLTFEPQMISSLSALSNMENLMELDLTGCRFSADELTNLVRLPALETLILADCGLSTISDLEGIIALHKLDVSNNTIRNLEVLSNMVTLKEINLTHNAVIDLTPLSNLTELEQLDVSFNALTTLKPLSGCSKLTWLDAGNNKLTGLSGLQNLTQMTTLCVEFNQLTDVSGLSALTNLTNLSIASNSITDISTFNSLNKLEIFDFSGNQIAALPAWGDDCALQTIDGSYNALTSIDTLKKMKSLTHVFMDYNVLTNIDALADCFCLVQINVFGNEIKDVSSLRDHDIIVNYDPTYAMSKE